MNPAEHVLLDLFIGTFSARADEYVMNSREHIHSALTPESLRWHWAQGNAVSGYTALTEGEATVPMTNVGAIDLDEGTWEEAVPITELLADHHIPSLLVPSRRGAHIWTFHTGNGEQGSENFGLVPARVVRAALTMAVELSGWAHPKEKAEVFPRKGTSPWSCGALRFPLMKHPKDGQVRLPMTEGGVRLNSITEVVEATASMTAPYSAVYALSGLDMAEVPYPSGLGPWRLSGRRVEDVPGAVSLLQSIGVEAVAGRACLCPFHEDSHKSLSVAADDLRVFCKQPSCDLFNDGRGLGSIQLERYMREHNG